MTSTIRPAISSRRMVLLLGSLAAIGPLSIDMYLPAFPQMALDLGVSLGSVEASLAAFFAGLSCAQLLYGPLSDRFGRKAPMLVGLTLYGISSACCALAANIDTIIALRFFQAMGACGGMVVSRAVVRDCYNHQEAARMFSMLMLVMGVAPILAPLAGGYLSAAMGWRAIFWLLVAFSALCIILIAPLLPETHGRDPSVKLARSLATYFEILRNQEFLRFALAGSVAQAGMFAYITGSPFVFIDYFGIPAKNFGWIFGVNALGLIVMSQINAQLLRRYSYQYIVRRSFWVLLAASLLLILAGSTNAGFWPVAIPLFIYIGFGYHLPQYQCRSSRISSAPFG